MTDFSLVVPTYNEGQGLRGFVERVCGVLTRAGFTYELVVVDDDSPDGTGALADELASQYPLRVIHRKGKKGLSSAVIDGWQAASGRVLGVTDADLSHDATILPAMVDAVLHGGADLAVGSRYVPGGGMGDWPLKRQIISRVACFLGSFLAPVRDITSGYICFRREVIAGVELDPIGFKIGLEVMVRGNYRTVVEIPYVFQDRKQGESKLSFKVIQQYLIQLGRLFLYTMQNRRTRVSVKPEHLAQPIRR